MSDIVSCILPSFSYWFFLFPCAYYWEKLPYFLISELELEVALLRAFVVHELMAICEMLVGVAMHIIKRVDCW